MKSVLAERWNASAARGALELPTCAQCGTVQYPLREVCVRCLSEEVHFQPVAPTGTVVATTRLHRTNHPHFRSLLPLRIGTIQLDVGARVIAFLPDDCGHIGERVQVRCELGPGGQAVLRAATDALQE